MFSSVMRAQLSLAWVIGPPLAFMAALNYGFTTMFFIAAEHFVGMLSALIAIKLPSRFRGGTALGGRAAALAQAGGWQDRTLRMLFIASTLMWTQHHVASLICRCGSAAISGFPTAWPGS